MHKVYLYGSLADTFGKEHQFAIASVPEAVQALRANFPAFTAAIREGHYRVVVGASSNGGLELDAQEAAETTLNGRALHIVPVIKGSKRGGLGKIIAGIAMIGLGAMTGGAGLGAFMGKALWGTTTVGSVVGSVGTSILLTGIASFLAPEIKEEETKQSYTSSGPATSTKEGGIVPIAYGEVITGGVMVNGILSVRTTGGRKQKMVFKTTTQTAVLSVTDEDFKEIS